MKYSLYLTSLLSFLSLAGTVKAEENIHTRKNIEPLLKTQWGQDSPFYYSTPTLDGQHCRTGCGATALSQVIYYHHFPQQPASGIYSYQTGRFGSISFDFSKASFDYDKMKLYYHDSEPEDDPAVREVSELMLAAGVILNMDYDLNESSALFVSIVSGLTEWFQYPDQGMKLISRDFLTNDEWEQLIYDELKEGRPVLYLGGNGVSSHIFVCDGYEDGKFHMNWGWYGEKDGYFSLTNLQTERAKGDGILSLNSGQKIIVGVRTPQAPLPDPVSYATGFDYNQNSDTFSLSELAFSFSNVSAVPGIKATDGEGSDYFFWSEEPISLSKSTIDLSYSVSLNSIPDGNYVIRPVYKPAEDSNLNDGVYNIYCNPRKTRFFEVVISNNRIVSAEEGTDATINVTISDFKTPSPLIKGETFNANFSIFAENIGNTGIDAFKLKFYLPDTDTPVQANEQRTVVHLTPGEATTVVMAVPSNLPAGIYDMYVVDGSGGTQDTYPVLSSPIRINWRDNAGIFIWKDYNLRAMALSETSEEAILLKNKPTAPSVAQGLEGDLIIPTVIHYTSPSEIMTRNTKELKVSELGPQLVYNETGLKKVFIPKTVTNIGQQAFAGCSGLEEIRIDAETPPTLQNKVFDEATMSSATLMVPAGSIDTYRSTDGWKDFTNIQADTTDSTETGDLAISSFSITPGSSVMVPVSLNTNVDYFGCQFELELPDGLSITSNGVTVSKILDTGKYTAGFSSKSDNSYIILLYSDNHNPFPTGNTELVDIVFKATQNFKGGTINVTNIEFSKNSGEVDTAVEFNPCSCFVTLDGVPTWVSDIENPDNIYVDVYNIAGILVKENILLKDAGTSLPPGLYVLKNDSHCLKIMVR